MFLIKKSYQDIDTSLQSAVVTKVKGVAYTNTTMLGERLWDVADFVIPSQVRSLCRTWAGEVWLGVGHTGSTKATPSVVSLAQDTDRNPA